ncbi:MAG TPA: hypothetical protein VK681_27470 [Reyranella sp.]|nr:hypothetical protein [Reyranella sp.]
MAEDIFGPLVSPEDVIDAVTATLRIWMPEYLADRERKTGLERKAIPRPPTPQSYHGGTDFESWIGAEVPEVMVTAKPSGQPEIGSYGYTQAYAVGLGCLCVGVGGLFAERAEDDARIMAGHYGAASMLLVQQPDLGGLAERLRMTALPEVTFPDPERRAIQQSITEFEVWVPQVIKEDAGPLGPNPQESPGYEGHEEPFDEAPTVETVDIKVTVE